MKAYSLRFESKFLLDSRNTEKLVQAILNANDNDENIIVKHPDGDVIINMGYTSRKPSFMERLLDKLIG